MFIVLSVRRFSAFFWASTRPSETLHVCAAKIQDIRPRKLDCAGADQERRQMMLGPSLAFFLPDGVAEADQVACRPLPCDLLDYYREPWLQLFACLVGVVQLRQHV